MYDTLWCDTALETIKYICRIPLGQCLLSAEEYLCPPVPDTHKALEVTCWLPSETDYMLISMTEYKLCFDKYIYSYWILVFINVRSFHEECMVYIITLMTIKSRVNFLPLYGSNTQLYNYRTSELTSDQKPWYGFGRLKSSRYGLSRSWCWADTYVIQ